MRFSYHDTFNWDSENIKISVSTPVISKEKRLKTRFSGKNSTLSLKQR